MEIAIDRGALAAYCQRWHITRLSFFGSVLREDFGPASDIDILVEFAEGMHPGLRIVTAKSELEDLFGRSVDLVNRRAVELDPNYLRRRSILGSAQVLVDG